MTRSKNSNFGTGGCFVCVMCGKQTRATGRGDHENVEMCAKCYDLAELENAHSDGHHDDKKDPNCAACEAASSKEE